MNSILKFGAYFFMSRECEFDHLMLQQDNLTIILNGDGHKFQFKRGNYEQEFDQFTASIKNALWMVNESEEYVRIMLKNNFSKQRIFSKHV